MKEQIIKALGNLDPLNEEHWTGQGLARVDVVSTLAGLPDLKRKDVVDLAPSFNRDTARGYIFGTGEPESEPAVDSPVLLPLASLQAQRASLQAELEDVQRAMFDLRVRESDLIGRLEVLDGRIARESPPLNTALQVQAYQRRQQEIAAQGGRPPLSPIDQALAVNPKRTKQRPQYPVN